jgi:hypothetical protein
MGFKLKNAGRNESTGENRDECIVPPGHQKSLLND